MRAASLTHVDVANSEFLGNVASVRQYATAVFFLILTSGVLLLH